MPNRSIAEFGDGDFPPLRSSGVRNLPTTDAPALTIAQAADLALR